MPTMKQKKAFEKILEKPRAIGTVMREVGYSENTIVDPKNLTESKGWKELMEIHLPDDRLAKKHSQLLEDEKSEIQVKTLDMAYKLKGSYAPEKTVNVNLEGKIEMSPKEKELKEEYEAKIQESYLNEQTV